MPPCRRIRVGLRLDGRRKGPLYSGWVKIRILLVDSDRAWLELTSAMLATQYDVAVAGSPDEAMLSVRRWQPQLVVADAGFSGLKAVGLIQKLQAEPGLPAVGVLVATDDGAPGSQFARFPSFKGCLAKGCPQRELQEAVAKALLGGGRVPAPPEAIARASWNVVVTDDEPTFLQFLDLALHRPDVRFHKASGGREALELIRRVRPELVISDMMMPDLTGIELMRELAKDDVLKDIPCILVTSTKMKPQQVEMLLKDFPAVRYVLTKPCSIEALRAAFRSAFKG